MKKAIAVFMAIICLISYCFSGCSLFDKGTGKNFFYPVYSDTDSFDPQIADDEVSKIVAQNCFEGLVKFDENGNIVPGVALKWEISDDKMTYTFHLDENARWFISSEAKEVLSNYTKNDFNNKVTAEDFVFGFKRYFDPETKAKADSRLYLIKNAPDVASGSKSLSELGITAVDTKTLQIRLSKPSDTFLEALTMISTMPCREEFFLATKGRYGLETKYLICNGPFYLSYRSDGNYIQMTKNEDFVNSENVYPANVFLYVNTDEDSRINKLESGVYDACKINFEQKQNIQDKKITYKNYDNSVWGFCFNCLQEDFSNTDLRVAVCQSIDTSLLSQPEYVTGPAQGFIPGACTVGDSKYRSIAGKANFIEFNEESAREHFQSALNKLGKTKINATLICSEDIKDDMRRLVQNWQKNFGMSFKITIEGLTVDEIEERISNDDFDIAFYCINTPYAFASDFLNMFTENGGYKLFNFTSLKYLTAVEEASQAVDTEDMVKKCAEAESVLMKSGVMYPVFSENGYLALAESVRDIYLSHAGTIPVFEGGKRVD